MYGATKVGEDVKGALVSVCEIRRELNYSSIMCQFWSFSGRLAKIIFVKGVALEFWTDLLVFI